MILPQPVNLFQNAEALYDSSTKHDYEPSMRSVGILLATSMCCLVVESAAAADCLQYEPATVTLQGTISPLRSGFGPPGYGEDPAHDSKEYWYVIVLDKPICVGASLYDDPESNVTEMQILYMDGLSSHGNWVGKHVAMTGTLFHAFTGHHRTKVLITEQGGRIVPKR